MDVAGEMSAGRKSLRAPPENNKAPGSCTDVRSGVDPGDCRAKHSIPGWRGIDDSVNGDDSGRT